MGHSGLDSVPIIVLQDSSFAGAAVLGDFHSEDHQSQHCSHEDQCHHAGSRGNSFVIFRLVPGAIHVHDDRLDLWNGELTVPIRIVLLDRFLDLSAARIKSITVRWLVPYM